MKHNLFISLILGMTFLLMPSVIYAQSTKNERDQEARTEELRQRQQMPEEIVYTLPTDSTFAHWSWRLDLGASMFDGDTWEPDGQQVAPTSDIQFTAGFNLERTFNPIVGLGLDYQFMPYKAGARNDELWYNLEGSDHEISILMSINMLNMFYRSRPQRWNLYAAGGIGASFYKAKMTNKYDGVIVDTWGDYVLHEPMDLKDGFSYTFPVSISLEYNVDKRFALGISYEYRFHNKDNYEGNKSNVRKGTANDGFHLITASFRHKVHSSKIFHVRNYHYGDPTFASLNSKILQLEEILKDLPDADSCCQARAEEISQLRAELNKRIDSACVGRTAAAYVKPVDITASNDEQWFSQAPVPELDRGQDRDRDGVPDIDDQCPELKGTAENHGCPELTPEEIEAFNKAIRGIQFDANKATIKPSSYPVMDVIVKILREKTNYKIVIVGHTDNLGGAKYNKELSSRRARSVRQYLINMGVGGERLRSEGKGVTEPVATNSTPEGRAMNRRVEFIIK